MHPIRKRKLQLIVVLLGVLAIAIGLILYALRQNISLFYTPTQIATGKAPRQHLIRVGGMVVAHSVSREPDGLGVSFKITDYAHTIKVYYRGILPDLFREGQSIVTQGTLTPDQLFEATQVLAKHDENYMPPEIKASLKAKRLST
ncbi:MAG TPA: cytochrome c maturation protein CcmE [Legionellaceae bacterium]|nr:cytochrome c maturation protein CcmE [Legionellaceae bacterium]